MINLLRATFNAHTSVLLWGPPGVGKSATAGHLARLTNAKLFVIYLSHKADNEVHGQPVIARDTVELDGRQRTIVEMAPPRYAVEAMQSQAKGERVILNFEEMTTIPPASAGPALAIFGEKVISEMHLDPRHVAIMGCANPSAQAAGGWDLSPPSSRRFTHLAFRLNAPSWAESFTGYWGAPPQLGWDQEVDAEEWARDRAMVAAYIHSFPELLFHLPKEHARRAGCWMEAEVMHVGGWSCPATWDKLSRHLTFHRLSQKSEMPISEIEMHELCIGEIGHEGAMQFLTWRDKMDMPSPSEIMAHPDRVSDVPPNRSDMMYYIVQGCVEQVKHLVRLHQDKPTNKGLFMPASEAWKICWQILGRVVAGPLHGEKYKDVLQDMLSGRRPMQGPKDIGAVGARHLSGPECQIKSVDVRDVDEISLFNSVRATADVDWTRTKK